MSTENAMATTTRRRDILFLSNVVQRDSTNAKLMKGKNRVQELAMVAAQKNRRSLLQDAAVAGNSSCGFAA